jgi:D-serine dehydratase
LIGGPDHAHNETRVTAFLDHLCAIAEQCAGAGLFAAGPVIMSAGGSAYYDLVAERFAKVKLDREIRLIIRSGCYLTHDSIMYRKAFERLLTRTPQAQDLGAGLQPALEVWAYVQSRPEAGRVLLTLGKRDASYDAGLPAPFAWFRPGTHQRPQSLADGHKAVDINDQHMFLDVPADSPLQVGDMLGCGISHPCLTFDKWQVLAVVDDDYQVVSMIRTFF